MGINNFMKLVQKYAPEAVKITNIKDYQNKILGIDANLMIYKMIFGIRKSGYDIEKGDTSITHIHAIILKIAAFKKYNITPIFVFDNGFDDMKQNIINERNIARTNMTEKYKQIPDGTKEQQSSFYMKSGITHEEIEDVKVIIKLCGYQVLIAKEEADSQLAYMSKNNIIDGVITDDVDILVFGAKNIIKNFSVSTNKNKNKNKQMQEINLNIILKKMNITRKQLIDISIMLGCDYCSPVKGIGPVNAYKLVKQYTSMSNFIIHYSNTKNNMPLGSSLGSGLGSGKEYKFLPNENYKQVKTYFENPVHKLTKINKISKINIDEITKFLNKKGYNNQDITNTINKLNNIIIYK